MRLERANGKRRESSRAVMHSFGKDFPKRAAEDMILWNETVEIHVLAAVLFQSSAFPPALTQSWSEIVPETGWRLCDLLEYAEIRCKGSSIKLTVTEHARLNTLL